MPIPPVEPPRSAIRVLLVEDNPADARLVVEALSEANSAAAGQPEFAAFEVACADCLATGLERLAQAAWDVLLLDLSLPDSQGLATFARVFQPAPAVPILLLTGLEDETLAMQAIQAGAQDYLLKGQVTAPLLARAIRYAIERGRLIAELRTALREIKTLSGLLPICAGCKQIRDVQGRWIPVETYVRDHSMANFSHGMCPDCIKKYYPEVDFGSATD